MLLKISLFTFFTVLSTLTFAQAADGLPYGKPEPVEWNLFNIIILIVLPVVLLIFYLWYRNRKNKR